MSNPRTLTMEEPLDMDDARRASQRMAQRRRDGEDAYEAQIDKAAEAERTYRKALARALVAAEGRTAAEKEATARAVAADEAYDRDLQAGMVKAMGERLKGIEGERSMLKSLIEMSSRILERMEPPPGPTFGGRR